MSLRLVYFIKPVHVLGPIKIGVTDHIESRLRDLQTASPLRLEVAATTPGGYRKERALHERFASARLHGEWFEATEELVEYIAALRQGITEVDAPRERTRDYRVTPLKGRGIHSAGIKLKKREVGLLFVATSFFDFYREPPTYAQLCEATKLNRVQVHRAVEGLCAHKLVSLSPAPPTSAIREPFPVRSVLRVAA